MMLFVVRRPNPGTRPGLGPLAQIPNEARGHILAPLDRVSTREDL